MGKKRGHTVTVTGAQAAKIHKAFLASGLNMDDVARAAHQSRQSVWRIMRGPWGEDTSRKISEGVLYDLLKALDWPLVWDEIMRAEPSLEKRALAAFKRIVRSTSGEHAMGVVKQLERWAADAEEANQKLAGIPTFELPDNE